LAAKAVKAREFFGGAGEAIHRSPIPVGQALLPVRNLVIRAPRGARKKEDRQECLSY